MKKIYLLICFIVLSTLTNAQICQNNTAANTGRFCHFTCNYTIDFSTVNTVSLSSTFINTVFPSQSGNSGRVLSTNGTNINWAALTTTDVPEGSNLYWTSARFNSAFTFKTTDDLVEGSTNIYFNNSRARNAISLTTTGTSGTATYNSSTGALNIPVIPAAQVNADWNSVSGVSQVLNKPTLGTAAATSSSDYATAAQGALAATALQPASALNPANVSQTSSYRFVTDAEKTTWNGKFNTPSGTTAQYIRGDGTPATFPSALPPNGSAGGSLAGTYPNPTLTSIVAADTYNSVTVTVEGRVASGTKRSINDNPGRSLVSATNATGFQISSTRDAVVNYEGTFQTTSTIGGPSSITVFLETANTNSTTPGDWTIIARQINSSTITLAVVLQQVDTEPWGFSRTIPAGKYVRIRFGSVTGTASASINTEQQEVTQ